MPSFKTIYLGCKVNHYECSALKALFSLKGYIEDDKNPDVIVINTCSVTMVADQKSRQIIRRYRKKFPHCVLIVMGCYAQNNHEFIIDELGADIVVGTSSRGKIIDLIDVFNKTKQPIDVTEDKPRLFYQYEELSSISCSENVRAYLKIQDGCDNFCSYCLIPLTRGRSRSRNPEQIILEAKNLINLGYKEIVLTGIDVGAYGKDLNDISFADLVEKLSNLNGLYCLRISSIEESEIDDKLIELVKNKKNIAKHLHIPLQSGNSNTLKRMNRRYDTASFLAKINKIRKEIPDIALTSDVIVGFPGETEEEFNSTKDFILKAGFNMLHVFPFSPRRGTKAYLMEHQVDNKTKSTRVHELIELSNILWNRYLNKFIGKEVEALIESFKKEDNLYVGHTSNYLEVKINSNKNIVGTIIKTKYKKI